MCNKNVVFWVHMPSLKKSGNEVIIAENIGKVEIWQTAGSGVYTGVAMGYAARVWQESGKVFIRSNSIMPEAKEDKSSLYL